MDHNFVFNTLSLPAANKEEAYRLLLDSAKGMFAVRSNKDRIAMYSEGLDDLALAPNYFYRDFITQLGERREEDIQLALMEVDDKTPMFDFLPDELVYEIASSNYYLPGEAYEGSVDVLAVAWHLNATLLSIATTDEWRGNEIEFANYVEGKPATGSSYLRNISCKEHGELIRRQFQLEAETPLEELFPECLFSEDFFGWIRDLHKDLYSRVINKVALAYAKKFQGGEPLFKTLHDADGIREIRFSAVQGGAVRILFRVLAENRAAILFGFIKKGDNEGYAEAIGAAKANLKRLLQ